MCPILQSIRVSPSLAPQLDRPTHLLSTRIRKQLHRDRGNKSSGLGSGGGARGGSSGRARGRGLSVRSLSSSNLATNSSINNGANSSAINNGTSCDGSGNGDSGGVKASPPTTTATKSGLFPRSAGKPRASKVQGISQLKFEISSFHHQLKD